MKIHFHGCFFSLYPLLSVVLTDFSKLEETMKYVFFCCLNLNNTISFEKELFYESEKVRKRDLLSILAVALVAPLLEFFFETSMNVTLPHLSKVFGLS